MGLHVHQMILTSNYTRQGPYLDPGSITIVFGKNKNIVRKFKCSQMVWWLSRTDLKGLPGSIYVTTVKCVIFLMMVCKQQGGNWSMQEGNEAFLSFTVHARDVFNWVNTQSQINIQINNLQIDNCEFEPNSKLVNLVISEPISVSAYTQLHQFHL